MIDWPQINFVLNIVQTGLLLLACYWAWQAFHKNKP